MRAGVGFAGPLRRSELAGIMRADLERTDQGYELTLKRTKGSQTEAVLVPLPYYGRTELCPVRALAGWLDTGAITDGPVFRRLWLPAQVAPDAPPPLPAISTEALPPRSIARIVQPPRRGGGFRGGHEFGGHSLKRGALSTGMQAGAHAARLKRLGRHKSLDVLGEYLGTAASLGVRGPERYFRVYCLTRGGRVVWILRLAQIGKRRLSTS
jgi:hypothetical protein